MTYLIEAENGYSDPRCGGKELPCRKDGPWGALCSDFGTSEGVQRQKIHCMAFAVPFRVLSRRKCDIKYLKITCPLFCLRIGPFKERKNFLDHAYITRS